MVEIDFLPEPAEPEATDTAEPPRRGYRASVSFESDLQPVRTYRGEIAAVSPAAGARRAVERARKEFPGVRWRSIVVVLEKLEE